MTSFPIEEAYPNDLGSKPVEIQPTGERAASSTGRGPMFSLSEILPSWRGERADFVRAPLLAGIAIKQAQLADARWAVISVVTTFDYDGMYEEVGEILGCADLEAGTAICHELLASRMRELLAANPSWAPIGSAVLPRAVMPATRAVLDGDPLPPYVCGAKVGNEVMYDSVYVRCYVCPAIGLSDPLTNLLTQLASAGLASLDESLIAYLTRAGEAI
jgi:hypothetical protein